MYFVVLIPLHRNEIEILNSCEIKNTIFSLRISFIYIFICFPAASIASVQLLFLISNHLVVIIYSWYEERFRITSIFKQKNVFLANNIIHFTQHI